MNRRYLFWYTCVGCRTAKIIGLSLQTHRISLRVKEGNWRRRKVRNKVRPAAGERPEHFTAPTHAHTLEEQDWKQIHYETSLWSSSSTAAAGHATKEWNILYRGWEWSGFKWTALTQHAESTLTLADIQGLLTLFFLDHYNSFWALLISPASYAAFKLNDQIWVL